ncbi:MAG: hypothetical protein N3E45_11575 [Oscillatoriaceae bacterium SKW80]|nr:hypothetical protein [Oscillatoriaceae bacterium SKYG93]MCX8121443.1 hypothetical protein [Oscillatoriaceae bacterium SKW80]MDW8455143.1 hypothetical protein [Oscillatoriaceae cyanobacterium SKYGB_i_bin93]HIK26458.1 hypothetical protein [Oscillatoriaceae cyanobacterium M7585_C2015_266]
MTSYLVTARLAILQTEAGNRAQPDICYGITLARGVSTFRILSCPRDSLVLESKMQQHRQSSARMSIAIALIDHADKEKSNLWNTQIL